MFRPCLTRALLSLPLLLYYTILLLYSRLPDNALLAHAQNSTALWACALVLNSVLLAWCWVDWFSPYSFTQVPTRRFLVTQVHKPSSGNTANTEPVTQPSTAPNTQAATNTQQTHMQNTHACEAEKVNLLKLSTEIGSTLVHKSNYDVTVCGVEGGAFSEPKPDCDVTINKNKIENQKNKDSIEKSHQFTEYYNQDFESLLAPRDCSVSEKVGVLDYDSKPVTSQSEEFNSEENAINVSCKERRFRWINTAISSTSQAHKHCTEHQHKYISLPSQHSKHNCTETAHEYTPLPTQCPGGKYWLNLNAIAKLLICFALDFCVCFQSFTFLSVSDRALPPDLKDAFILHHLQRLVLLHILRFVVLPLGRYSVLPLLNRLIIFRVVYEF